jgi:Uri superfamily endonuclease
MAHMDRHGDWRNEPGSYLLVLQLPVETKVAIGRLGEHGFPAGRYVYAGSALGPGGVAGRLNRHFRCDKRTHWHIDYLTAIAPVTAVAAWYGPERKECLWSHRLTALPRVGAPAPGFGSTDCRAGCLAHLWLLPPDLSLSWIESELTQCPLQTI